MKAKGIFKRLLRKRIQREKSWVEYYLFRNKIDEEKSDLILYVLLQIQKIQEGKRTNWVMLEGKTLWK